LEVGACEEEWMGGWVVDGWVDGWMGGRIRCQKLVVCGTTTTSKVNEPEPEMRTVMRDLDEGMVVDE
jgi:hypothetical protein